MNHSDRSLCRLPKRFHLSVRMLLAFVLVIGLAMAWMVHLAREERNAVFAIEKIGGKVHYDWDSRVASTIPPPSAWWPRWLANWTGLDFESHVVSVNLSKGESDATLVLVRRLKRLVNLNLNQSDVTDASLSHLKGSTSLRGLWLNNNRITDAGLVHLRDLTNLQGLYLGATGITDVGLAHLEDLTNLTELSLHTTKVTDAGLAHLRRMTKLKTLYLRGAPVTDKGLEDLKKSLPSVHIHK